MPHDLIAIITTSDPTVRDRSLDGFCRTADVAALRDAARALDAFRRQSENLYERVRATFFLAAIYRYHLPAKLPPDGQGPGAVRRLHASLGPAFRRGDR